MIVVQGGEVDSGISFGGAIRAAIRRSIAAHRPEGRILEALVVKGETVPESQIVRDDYEGREVCVTIALEQPSDPAADARLIVGDYELAISILTPGQKAQRGGRVDPRAVQRLEDLRSESGGEGYWELRNVRISWIKPRMSDG